MQHTTLPGRNATGRTGDGGNLFWSEIALFHPVTMRLHTVAILYICGHRLFLGCLMDKSRTEAAGMCD
jgi:hypothetical protein